MSGTPSPLPACSAQVTQEYRTPLGFVLVARAKQPCAPPDFAEVRLRSDRSGAVIKLGRDGHTSERVDSIRYVRFSRFVLWGTYAEQRVGGVWKRVEFAK